MDAACLEAGVGAIEIESAVVIVIVVSRDMISSRFDGAFERS